MLYLQHVFLPRPCTTVRVHRYPQMIIDVLKAEEAVDLIALSGDMVSGHAWDGTEGWYSTMYATSMPACDTVPTAACSAERHPCAPSKPATNCIFAHIPAC